MRTITLLHDANGREIFILPLSDRRNCNNNDRNLYLNYTHHNECI